MSVHHALSWFSISIKTPHLQLYNSENTISMLLTSNSIKSVITRQEIHMYISHVAPYVNLRDKLSYVGDIKEFIKSKGK
jgi:hypothetical protein